MALYFGYSKPIINNFDGTVRPNALPGYGPHPSKNEGQIAVLSMFEENIPIGTTFACEENNELTEYWYTGSKWELKNGIHNNRISNYTNNLIKLVPETIIIDDQTKDIPEVDLVFYIDGIDKTTHIASVLSNSPYFSLEREGNKLKYIKKSTTTLTKDKTYNIPLIITIRKEAFNSTYDVQINLQLLIVVKDLTPDGSFYQLECTPGFAVVDNNTSTKVSFKVYKVSNGVRQLLNTSSSEWTISVDENVLQKYELNIPYSEIKQEGPDLYTIKSGGYSESNCKIVHEGNKYYVQNSIGEYLLTVIQNNRLYFSQNGGTKLEISVVPMNISNAYYFTDKSFTATLYKNGNPQATTNFIRVKNGEKGDTGESASNGYSISIDNPIVMLPSNEDGDIYKAQSLTKVFIQKNGEDVTELFTFIPEGNDNRYLLLYDSENKEVYIKLNSNIGSVLTQFVKTLQFKNSSNTILQVKQLFSKLYSDLDLQKLLQNSLGEILFYAGEFDKTKEVTYYYRGTAEGSELSSSYLRTDYVSRTTTNVEDDSISIIKEYYKCKRGFKHVANASWNDSYWEKLEYKDSMLINNLKAANIQTESLLLTDSSNNIRGGADGKLKSTINSNGLEISENVDNHIIFWAGSNYSENSDIVSKSDAPFKVFGNGDVVANSIKISGWEYLLPKKSNKYLTTSRGKLALPCIEIINDVPEEYGTTENILGPSELGKFINIDKNLSVLLPSFAYYRYKETAEPDAFYAPGIFEECKERTIGNATYYDYAPKSEIDDNATNYIAYCRQLIGNRIMVVMNNDALTLEYGRYGGGFAIGFITDQKDFKSIDLISYNDKDIIEGYYDDDIEAHTYPNILVLKDKNSEDRTPMILTLYSNNYSICTLECKHFISVEDDILYEMVYWELVSKVDLEGFEDAFTANLKLDSYLDSYLNLFQ